MPRPLAWASGTLALWIPSPRLAAWTVAALMLRCASLARAGRSGFLLWLANVWLAALGVCQVAAACCCTLLLPIHRPLACRPPSALQRRSSRVASRYSKEEEARRQQELELQALAAATAAEQAEAAAAAAAARAMAVVPTTASGAPATQLLDVLPEQRLALLLQQASGQRR